MAGVEWTPPAAVWRLVRSDLLAGRSARDMFQGEGCATTAGRWHRKGTRVAYCSVSLATTMLEVLVHTSQRHLRQDFTALRAHLPTDSRFRANVGDIETVTIADLPDDWDRHPPIAWTQEYGTAWAQSRRSLGLAVPSAVVPLEWNVILNPLHPAMASLGDERVANVRFDPRILAYWNLES